MRFAIETRDISDAQPPISPYLTGPHTFREMVKEIIECENMGFIDDPEWEVKVYTLHPTTTDVEQILKNVKNRERPENDEG